ncbi:MAG: hypothetical protein AAFU79_07450, partial [Myxococcota bacterium]
PFGGASQNKLRATLDFEHATHAGLIDARLSAEALADDRTHIEPFDQSAEIARPGDVTEIFGERGDVDVYGMRANG